MRPRSDLIALVIGLGVAVRLNADQAQQTINWRQRADAAYADAITQAELGNTAGAAGFARIALDAYDQVANKNHHVRLHMGLLHLLMSNRRAAQAQADTIAQRSPTSLFGPLLEWHIYWASSEGEGISAIQARMWEAWDREWARDWWEYHAHRPMLDEVKSEIIRRSATWRDIRDRPTSSVATSRPAPSSSSAPSTAGSTGATTNLPPLRPSISTDAAAAELRILDAADRSQACSSNGLSNLRATHRVRIDGMRQIERESRQPPNATDYRVMQNVANDVAEDLDRVRSWSNCGQVRSDLANVWRDQAQRVRNHVSGLASGPALSSTPTYTPAAPTTGELIGQLADSMLSQRARDQRRANQPAASPSRPAPPSPPSRTAAPPPSYTPPPSYEAPAAEPQAVAEPLPRIASNPAHNCADFVYEGNNVFMRNNCSGASVNVKWWDQDFCRTGCGTLAARGLRPGQRETVSRPRGRYIIASCEHPAQVAVVNSRSDGWPTRYECR